MNPIYNFDEYTPPKLTEQMLCEELKRRALRRQTRILRLASLFVCICFLICAALLFPDYPVLALACTVFVIFSLAANGIISIVFYKTGYVPE
ncbi:MAG: hypothetical protein IJW37_03715 [Lachnospiraceae bacterium]|nr:hypothetical protein [Lachnospiraceae bacterium]